MSEAAGIEGEEGGCTFLSRFQGAVIAKRQGFPSRKKIVARKMVAPADAKVRQRVQP
jgi:hypothetical protein